MRADAVGWRSQVTAKPWAKRKGKNQEEGHRADRGQRRVALKLDDVERIRTIKQLEESESESESDEDEEG